MKDEEQPFLHTVRWVSAAVVAFGHALSLAFQRHPIDLPGFPVSSLVTYCADLGHAAVMLFFVISGYLVGGGVVERLNKFDLFHYWASRFARIYIALVPAIMMTIVLDGAAFLIDPQSPIYRTAWAGPIGHGAIFESYIPRNIAATLLSFESFIGEPFGSDRPLWSLGYEWVFYFLFPLTGLPLRRLRLSNLQACVAGAAIAAIPMLLLHQLFTTLFWLIWVAGAVARHVARHHRLPNWLGLAGGALAAAGFVLSPLLDHRLTDPMIGTGFAVFVACPQLLKHTLFGVWDRRFANSSYSLYIAHMPVLTFTCFLFSEAGLFSAGRFPIEVAGLGFWLLLCALAILTAAVYGRLFEARTDQFRAAILKLRKPRPAIA